jgi:hypothetical protein
MEMTNKATDNFRKVKSVPGMVGILNIWRENSKSEFATVTDNSLVIYFSFIFQYACFHYYLLYLFQHDPKRQRFDYVYTVLTTQHHARISPQAFSWCY